MKTSFSVLGQRSDHVLVCVTYPSHFYIRPVIRFSKIAIYKFYNFPEVKYLDL
jgi:hypothetical protein